jgi:hypothetical protein
MDDRIEKVKQAMDRIDRLFAELRAMTGRTEADCVRESVKQEKFLRGREPVLMICPDGVIRGVKPGMKPEEIGTNVIPLPCKRRES